MQLFQISRQNQESFPSRNTGQNVIDMVKELLHQSERVWLATTGIGDRADSGSSEGVCLALLKNVNMVGVRQGESVVKNYLLTCSAKLFIYGLSPHKIGRFLENSFNHVPQYFTP